MQHDTIPHRLLKRAETHPFDAGHIVRNADGWNTTDFKTFGDETMRVAKALYALEFAREMQSAS